MTIHWTKLIKNKNIETRARKLGAYWKIFRYGHKNYIMTFQFNIYEVTV